MTATRPNPERPVPRWVHVWAVVTVAAAAALLLLGGVVTTFRVGMADPVWPTEPWFLLAGNYQEPSPGFLIEHAHRLAGFTVGGLTAVLAFALWWTEPCPRKRWSGAALMGGLLVFFGEFHRAMRAAPEGSGWPTVPTVGMLTFLGGLLVLWVVVIFDRGAPRRALRVVGVAALVAVMAQGLLGGFRVRWNARYGIDLAAFHGVFAQVVFALLVSAAVLTAPYPAAETVPDRDRRRLRRLTIVLAGLVFLQQVWGALIRHMPSPMTQRLHLLTAFAVVVLGVWVIHLAYNAGPMRRRLVVTAGVLGALFAVQVTLGVEAYVGKFGAGVLPETQQVTPELAFVRTAHMFVGTWVFATAVILALKAHRRAAAEPADPGPARAPRSVSDIPLTYAETHQPGETI